MGARHSCFSFSCIGYSNRRMLFSAGDERAGSWQVSDRPALVFDSRQTGSSNSLVGHAGDSVMRACGLSPCTGLSLLLGIPRFGLAALDPTRQRKLWFVEGTCPATVTGYWSGKGHDHRPAPAVPVLLGNITTGCSAGRDQATTKINPPPYSGWFWSAGTWEWPISWYYGFSSGSAADTQFDTANHHMEIDASGNVTISKQGVSVTRAVADPHCPW